MKLKSWILSLYSLAKKFTIVAGFITLLSGRKLSVDWIYLIYHIWETVSVPTLITTLSWDVSFTIHHSLFTVDI